MQPVPEVPFFLEGLWRGAGRVIDSFEYDEEIEFTKVKPNVFLYKQKTNNKEKGPLHSEVGYVRIFPEHHHPEGRIEFALSHPFGVCEISEGKFTENTATLKTASVARTSSAIEPYVTKLSRAYKLKDADTLSYNVDMGTSKSTDEAPHLEGELKRVK